MPFPFYRLPIELREHIYVLYFQPVLGNDTITPDPFRTRGRPTDEELREQIFALYFRPSLPSDTVSFGSRKGYTDGKHEEPHPPNSIAILSTCQQAHEEATRILYSTSTFYFDDTPHSDFTHAIEASAHCKFCLRYRNLRDSGRLTGDYFDDCWHSRNDKHFIHVPHCDFVTMGDWLRGIGQKNRALIKHVHLHFTKAQFTKVLGMYYPSGGSEGKPCPVGGDLVVDALEVLGRSHCLRTIKITFLGAMEEAEEWRDEKAEIRSVECAFRDVFLPGSRLGAALRKIRGLTRFYCEEMKGTYVGEDGLDQMDAARTGLQDLRKHVEVGVVEKEEARESAVFWSKLSRWREKGVDQSKLLDF